MKPIRSAPLTKASFARELTQELLEYVSYVSERDFPGIIEPGVRLVRPRLSNPKSFQSGDRRLEGAVAVAACPPENPLIRTKHFHLRRLLAELDWPRSDIRCLRAVIEGLLGTLSVSSILRFGVWTWGVL